MPSDATYGSGFTKEQSERMNAFYEEVRDTKPIAELLAGAMPIARAGGVLRLQRWDVIDG